jgi:hypothetical protein
MELNGKKIGDVEIDGVDTKDYPDFCDAHFASATFEDGTELTDGELDELQNLYPEVVNEKAFEHYI